jgi:hypothetical protein
MQVEVEVVLVPFQKVIIPQSLLTEVEAVVVVGVTEA